MKSRLTAALVAVALLTGAPFAQEIQRGYGPTIPAGSGGATAGISSVLTVNTTTAQTGANTNETDLWTYSLPANTLSADNYGVRISAQMFAAATATVKTFRVYFGSTVVATWSASVNNRPLFAQVQVFRTGASSQKAMGLISEVSVSNTLTRTTPAADTTGAITIKVTGQNGTPNSGDIVFDAAMVEFLRAGS